MDSCFHSLQSPLAFLLLFFFYPRAAFYRKTNAAHMLAGYLAFVNAFFSATCTQGKINKFLIDFVDDIVTSLPFSFVGRYFIKRK